MAKSIGFRCRQCGHHNIVAYELAGQTTKCGGCAATVPVPVPRQAPEPGPGEKGAAEAGQGKTLKFACGHCLQRQYAHPEWGGKILICCGCGKKVRVPQPAAAASRPAADRPAGVQTATRTASKSASGTKLHAPPSRPLAAVEKVSSGGLLPDDLYALDDGGAADEPAPVLPRLTPPPVSATPAEEPKPKKKRKKRKKSSGVGLEGKEAVQFGAMIAAGTVVAFGIGYAIVPIRPVIALLLLAAGGILAVIGNLGFSAAAREEGAIHGLLCKFVPLYKLYFLLRHWQTMRDYFVLYAVGMAMLAPGLFLWKITPDPLGDGGKDKPAATGAKAPGQAAMPAVPAVNVADDTE